MRVPYPTAQQWEKWALDFDLSPIEAAMDLFNRGWPKIPREWVGYPVLDENFGPCMKMFSPDSLHYATACTAIGAKRVREVI